jgi:hypothetical protein
MGYSVDKATINNDPIIKDIIDNINALNETGNDKLNGFGNNKVTTIIGILLNNVLEYL